MVIWKSASISSRKALELLVGAVQLVYQQHRGALVGGVYGLQQGPLDEEPLAEQPGRCRLAVNVSAGFQQAYLQQLPGVVPLIDGVAYIQPLVALQAYEGSVEGGGQGAGDLGLADAGLSFEEQWTL